MKRVHACQECGQDTTAKGRFCGTTCRMAFNNRRKQRGAQLYDFVMARRFDRKEADAKGIWAIMDRLASSFREEDIRERAGRKSWQSIRAATDALPVVVQSSDVYVGREKFGRAGKRA